MDLVIVESPTKAKTLSKFLGSKFKVLASMGHVRDLPKSQLGVDVEHDFEPQYVVPDKAKTVIKDLKAAASKAENVWLSTDPDREGEAIAWHIAAVLGGKQLTIDNSQLTEEIGNETSKVKGQRSKVSGRAFKRAVFHEITKNAVEEAFKHPRDLDLNLVNSQQARRVLDRLVGYKLSPLLWKKVARNLSAGRVQSVAVRLIAERERERLAFKPQEYWTIVAVLGDQIPDLTPARRSLGEGGDKDPGSTANQFEAQLTEKDGKKIEIGSETQAHEIENDLRASSYQVSQVKKEEKRRYPAPPFTTSALQQAGVNKLGFSASRIMRAAQALYERGLITYMRTDSVNLSTQFLGQAAEFIRKEFAQSYAPEKPIQYKTKSRLAQEAHEAIRPTNLELRSKNQELSGDEAKIYSLIYSRALASQMNPAVFDATTVDVTTTSETREANSYLLRASGSILKFDGWLRAWGAGQRLEARGERSEENDESEIGDNQPLTASLSTLASGDILRLEDLKSVQHFTQPSGRFTEATLVKALEEHGIGRPSTYAPIISTIQYRGYVGKEGRYLFPNDLGLVVNDLLVANFPQVVDITFTSKLEADLDEIAEGKKEWAPLLREFYTPFEKLVEEKDKDLQKSDFTTLEKLDETCPECGKGLIVKIGKFGKFVSCSGFPDCKFTKPMNSDGSEEKVDETQLGKCPEDGGILKVKRGRFGQFVACENYPNCKFTKPYLEKIGLKCPQCHEGEVIVKKSKFKKVFYGCSRYPECKFASWQKPGTQNQENLTSSPVGS